CPGEAVAHEEVAPGGVGAHLGEEPVEGFLGDGYVRLAPSNEALAPGLPHDEAVLRAAPGMGVRPDHERAAGGEAALTAAQRDLVEPRGREVVVERVRALDAEVGEVL